MKIVKTVVLVSLMLGTFTYAYVPQIVSAEEPPAFTPKAKPYNPNQHKQALQAMKYPTKAMRKRCVKDVTYWNGLACVTKEVCESRAGYIRGQVCLRVKARH